MAWTARIIASVRSDTDKRKALITLRYTDGTLTDTRVHTVGSLADLRGQVRGAINEYQAMSDFITALPGNGPFDPAEPVTPPSQDEIDRDAYFAARAKAQHIAGLLADGSTHVTQQTLAAAVTAWNALTFNPAWEGL
jgi:hypothetical protein